MKLTGILREAILQPRDSGDATDVVIRLTVSNNMPMDHGYVRASMLELPKLLQERLDLEITHRPDLDRFDGTPLQSSEPATEGTHVGSW